jgi:hypothetical protein
MHTTFWSENLKGLSFHLEDVGVDEGIILE